MDGTVLSKVAAIGAKYGIDEATLYSIMMNESGGNPLSHALTSQEDSRGLFQVNVRAHPDANASQLFDPVYNATYIMPQLSTAYNAGKAQGLTGVALAQYTEKNGERPQWTATVAANISKFYNSFVSGGGSSTSGTDTSGVISTGLGSTISSFWGNLTGVNVMDDVKFYLAYGIGFILLLFCLYMIFIKNDSVTA